ncbi:lipoprotein [Spiroplasma endosymbiont of Atherix ibis]|uniref:lipoprotein n=1 Tax=Spiroplasma endosymbiont of Atherix ibis TaxID=3066291 RepID=UPI0030CBCE2F
MKKLLSVISTATLVGTSTLTVVSCSSNKNYNEFKKWIDNKDSFILYIGEDNCPHCQDFEYVQKKYNKKLNEKISELNTSYNQKVVNQEGSEHPDSLIAYGQKLNNDVDLRTFKTEEYQSKFTEKWTKNILNWMIDEVTQIYKKQYTIGDMSDKLATKLAKVKVKQYFNLDKIQGFPIFILIRNGKLVSWENGFGNKPAGGWTETLLDNLFNPLITAMNNREQETEIINKVNDGTNSGSGGESGGSGGSGGESKTKNNKLLSYSVSDQFLNDFLINTIS